MGESSLVVGLDLGQSQDFSALAVVDHVRVIPEVALGNGRQLGVEPYTYGSSDGGVDELRVVHLQRWALGTSYDVIVEDVAALMRTSELSDSWLRFDATGVGRGVKDMLTKVFMDGRMGSQWPIGVTITGEGKGSPGTIPKRDLMSVLQVALQQHRLKIAEELELRGVLEQELRSFRLKISAAGRDTYEFKRREGSGHGDLTIAVSLAATLKHWQRLEVAVPETVP